MRQRLYDYLPVVGQNLACTAAGWVRKRRRFNKHFERTLERWERSASSPDDELRALQALRLVRVFEVARAHVPYYRDLPPVERHPDPAEAVQRSLARVSPLDKATYRDQPKAFLNRSIPRHSLISGHTSGTTGSALNLWYSAEGMAEEYASVWRMRRSFGVGMNMSHLTFGGQIVVPFDDTKPPFWRQDLATHATLFSLYHMKPENLSAYVDEIHECTPVYAQGYPSSLHLVGRALLDAGRPLPQGRLKAVFTSSESLLAYQRETIEAAFGAPVRDRYGASEFAVSMTSCEAGNLHVDMEYCVVEVEPQEENDEIVRGPLLVTGLGNLATPFIRYRIGDVGTRIKKPCICGRPGDVFLDIDGRIEDYVVTPDGRVVGRLDHVFKTQEAVAEAQILQDSRDAIRILVVPRRRFGKDAEGSLLREVRARLGDQIAVEIVPVQEIPREPNGKLRAVKSSIGRQAA